MVGAIKGANCTISSITDNFDGTHDITFSWVDTSDVTHSSTLTVMDGETPTMGVTTITNGHRVTFTTTTQSIAFDVTNGTQGTQGISVTSANVDSNNMLTFTLSSGTTISAGQIIAVVSVDGTLSTTSSNPVENKVITTALNNKVDKISGKGLSTEDYTTTEKNKLSNIEDSAEVNVIESVTVNGTEVTVVDKTIALTLLTTAVNNLTNYYLKTETYTKEEVQDLIGSTVGVSISIVSELPATGETNKIYFVPTATENVYSQYIYTSTDGWVLIGSTTVDLSNYYTKTQTDTLLASKQNTLTFDAYPISMSSNPVTSGGVYTAISQKQSQIQYSTMPTASADNLGQIYQYIGADGTYTQGRFYRCIYDSTTSAYSWEEVSFNATITVDSVINSTSTNPVQNRVISDALNNKQDIIQYSTVPNAQSNLGMIIQYVGSTTSAYTNGYFYKSVYDSTTDVYSWQVINFPTTIIIDSTLDSTSTNPVQNSAITTELTDLDTRLDDVETVVDALGTASSKDYTPYVRPNNHALVESNAVYNAIANAISSIYTAHGNLTCAELTSDLLIAANVGNIYNMTDSGTTTSLFIQGAGVTISAGNTVGIIKADETNIYFNLMGNMIDLSDYQTQTLETPLTIDGTSITTVEGALDALNTLASGKQDALTFDSAPTDSSTNPVTSGGIYTSENDIYATMGVVGAKNLIPYPYYHTTKTVNGITYTDNGDGSITINGTATATTDFVLGYDIELKAGDYIFSKNSSATSLTIQGNLFNGTTYISTFLNTTSDNVKFTITQEIIDTGYDIRFYLRVLSGVTVDNLTYYPMIRLASITDDTYEPYAMTNRELTDIHYSNAGAHNCVYRGKNLGTSVTDAQYAAISSGNFYDLYIGDYWVINSVNWRIAAFDYWYNTGDTNCTTHHVVIVPDSNLATCAMNSTDTTNGGYISSDFYTASNSNTGKATAVSAINSAFGSAHILSHREYLINAVTDGHPSAGTWVNSTVDLMNENMVYGSKMNEPMANGSAIYTNYTIDKSQLPLFQHDHSRISNRTYWWLRSVVSSAYFARIALGGGADRYNASGSFGVRPAFAIKA